MKTKSLPILLVCAFVLAFVTCKKEPDPNIQSFELSKEDLTVGTTYYVFEMDGEEKAGLAAYSHGEYFALGKKIGSFGYSHNKKRTKKSR